MAKTPPDSKKNLDSGESRRSFIAIFAGAVAMLTPLAAGVASFLSPLFRKATSPEVRVALLSQVPADGKPYFFSVITDREDAWNRYPQQKIGAVYLIRQPDEEIPKAFTAKCPHAGCSIGYSAEEQKFNCPCHTSSFNLDGSRARGDDEVSPRDMDTLEVTLNRVEITTGHQRRRRRRLRGLPEAEPNTVEPADGETVTEVLVKFVDFQTGHKEKKPNA